MTCAKMLKYFNKYKILRYKMKKEVAAFARCMQKSSPVLKYTKL